MKTLHRQNQTVIVIQGHQAKAMLRGLKTQPAVTVSAAIDLWASWMSKNAPAPSTAQSVGYAKAWARDAKTANLDVSSIEESHINKWINAKDGTKLGTRRVRLAIIRSLFKYLSVKELLNGSNPATLCRVDFSAMSHEQKEVKEPRPFTEAEFQSLLNGLEREILVGNPSSRARMTFWRQAAIISRCTGLRFGDVCQLEWSCLTGRFTVWTDKTQKRVQPYIWNQELFDATVKAIARGKSEFVFPDMRCDYLNAHRRPGLVMQFCRLCDSFDLDGHSFHDLRKSYATGCYREGIAMPHISASLGHSSGKTTEIYIAK